MKALKRDNLQKLESFMKLSWLKIYEALRKIFFFRFRLLPIVIFCSGLLLTVKISVLWQTLHPDEEVWGMAESYAGDSLKKTKASRFEKKVLKKDEPKPESVGKPVATHHVEADAIDPAILTREQFKILLELSERQREIAKREKSIPGEETTLTVIDQQIQDHTNELKKTKKRLEDLLSQVEEKENVNTARLVKMAESMKPKEAAQILETLEFPILLDLMERVKPKSGSAILASMEPAKAGYLMTELAKRRKLIKNIRAPKK